MDCDFLTIPGFEKLTKQELFDLSARHILRTRQKSMTTGSICTYQGSGCAASPFLREECRAEADDAVGNPMWGNLAEEGLVPDHELKFVSELQKCHDESSSLNFMPEWRNKMRRLADDYGLDEGVFA